MLRYEFKSVAFTNDMECRLKVRGFDISCNEGKLMLLELLVKAQAGFYNSHTEECFLKSWDMMKKDRTPNMKGRSFICHMIYASSHKRPPCFELMEKFRFKRD